MRAGEIGKGDLLIAVAVMAAMCATSFYFSPSIRISGGMGLCLPSPNLWNIEPIWSWGANTLLLGLIAVGCWLLNRTYNFIRSTRPVLPAMFLILAASNPWTDAYLTASTLLCAANLIVLAVAFGCYRSLNATQEMFLIGTIYSLGSMCQYAFLPFLLPVVAGAIIMKAFRVKEALAMLMGLVAPYWVGIGFGLLPLDSFRLPELSNLFGGFVETPDLIIILSSIGVAMFLGLLLGFNNSMKLYAGNSRVNALNMMISLMGVVSMVCIIVDFTNMMTYLATLYFTVAVQIANLCALWTFKREWVICLVPAVIYIGFFIAMVLV